MKEHEQKDDDENGDGNDELLLRVAKGDSHSSSLTLTAAEGSDPSLSPALVWPPSNPPLATATKHQGTCQAFSARLNAETVCI